MPPASKPLWETYLFAFADSTAAGLVDQLKALDRHVSQLPPGEFTPFAADQGDLPGPGPARLALLAGDEVELRRKLALASARLQEPGRSRLHDVTGIYYEAQPLGESGKVAFLFPGEGAQYFGMLNDVRRAFPEVQAFFDSCDQALLDFTQLPSPFSSCFLPSELADSRDRTQAELELRQIDRAMMSILVADGAVWHMLRGLGIRPDMAAGHSMGEIAALAAADATEGEDNLVPCIADAMADFVSPGDDLPLLLAVARGPAEVRELVQQSAAQDCYVAIENCPHQTVVMGWSSSIAKVQAELQRHRILCEPLPVSQPYHTPLFAPYASTIRAAYQGIRFQAPCFPVYSTVTGQPFPSAPEQIRELSLRNWTEPVRFIDVVHQLYDAGARIFVESGPKNTLCSFVDDILRDRPFVTVASNSARRPGLTQLMHCLAILFVHGVSWDGKRLRDVRRSAMTTGASASQPVLVPSSHRAGLHRFTVRGHAAVVQAFQTNMSKFLELQRGTMEQFLAARNGRQRGPTRPRRVDGRRPRAIDVTATPRGQDTEYRGPLLGAPTAYVPRTSARFVRPLDLNHDLFARHHTVGGLEISKRDPSHCGVPVVPMTFSLEMGAEAAQTLFPDLRIVTIRDVTLVRWLAYEFDSVGRLEIVAHAAEKPTSRNRSRVKVEIFDVECPTGQAPVPRLAARMNVDLAESYPAPPPIPEPLPAAPDRDLTVEQMYRCLFHGPKFQGMQRIRGWSGSGIEVDIRVPARSELLTGTPCPDWLIDPVLLDVVMHPMAVWHDGQEDRAGRIVLPVSAESFEFYGSAPAAGTSVRVLGELRSQHSRYFVHDGLATVNSTETPWVKLRGITCWRFYVPFGETNFHGPKDSYFVSTRVDSPPPFGNGLEERPAHTIMCLQVPHDLKQAAMQRVTAQITLTPVEYQEWSAMRGEADPDDLPLFRRLLAKDVSRSLWTDLHGVKLFPADIQAHARPNGAFRLNLRGSPDERLPHAAVTRVGELLIGVAAEGESLGLIAEPAEMELDQQEPQRRRLGTALLAQLLGDESKKRKLEFTADPALDTTCLVWTRKDGRRIATHFGSHAGIAYAWAAM